jgi:Tol biopolymer transport system component
LIIATILVVASMVNHHKSREVKIMSWSRLKPVRLSMVVVCLTLTGIMLPLAVRQETVTGSGDNSELFLPLVTKLIKPQNSRVSLASDGTQANGDSTWGSSSADGRYITFVSEASNLVSNDTNGQADVFLHDRQTGQTSRVSVASDGTQANNISWVPKISADGRYITFSSDATNLVSNDNNYRLDAFVHDRQTGQTSRVSVASDGTESDGSSGASTISADGRYIAFVSDASNLISDGSVYGIFDAFVHDRQTGQTSLVSVASDGTKGNQPSYRADISADGRYIAFDSHASNLVNDDTNNWEDVFVHDQLTGQTSRVSITPDGTEFTTSSYFPSISADGRYVEFTTHHVWVHDRQTGQTSQVSVAWNDVGSFSQLLNSSISTNGRFVTIRANDDNPLLGDTNDYYDIFIFDRQTGQTSLISMAWDGRQGNGDSHGSSLSGDGRYLAFYSEASNLVPGDTNGYQDVFVRDLGQ